MYVLVIILKTLWLRPCAREDSSQWQRKKCINVFTVTTATSWMLNNIIFKMDFNTYGFRIFLLLNQWQKNRV